MDYRLKQKGTLIIDKIKLYATLVVDEEYYKEKSLLENFTEVMETGYYNDKIDMFTRIKDLRRLNIQFGENGKFLNTYKAYESGDIMGIYLTVNIGYNEKFDEFELKYYKYDTTRGYVYEIEESGIY